MDLALVATAVTALFDSCIIGDRECVGIICVPSVWVEAYTIFTTKPLGTWIVRDQALHLNLILILFLTYLLFSVAVP